MEISKQVRGGPGGDPRNRGAILAASSGILVPRRGVPGEGPVRVEKQGPGSELWNPKKGGIFILHVWYFC